MSRRALMLGVRDALRTALGLDQRTCEVMFDGRPPPRAGKLFYSIHTGGRTSSDQNSLDERYEFMVTVTMRINEPMDLLGPGLLVKEQLGFFDVTDAVRRVLHMSYTAMNLANNTYLVPQATRDIRGFVEPAKFDGDDTPRFVAGEWFSAEENDTPPVGIAQTLRFGGARRVQDNASLQL